VVIDLNTLTTLPEREFRAGLAEVIKYGVALDPPFLNWVEQNLTQLLQRSGPWLQAMVGQALSIKAKIVAQDEYDQNLRLALNFGHTLGHALETQSGYQTLLHGEAVGIGMLGALYLSETKLYCNK
jgi:3-dehydroquinate synthase